MRRAGARTAHQVAAFLSSAAVGGTFIYLFRLLR
jgi:hypothetical protein